MNNTKIEWTDKTWERWLQDCRAIIRQLLAERREMVKVIRDYHHDPLLLSEYGQHVCLVDLVDCPYCTEARETEQEAADGK